MKPAPNTLTQIDELPGEEIEFGIGDPRFVMMTQADLYSDVTTAIIREYSTNAYDAHVMAGHNDPIEVTLPSLMDKFFVVRDHGVGMNLEIFRTIYTQFGVSDKRDSMLTNGQLGYGSKSGIAYATSFEVRSVRDGIKTEGVVMRRPDWSIVLKVIAQTKTDEHNGTVIKIPVHNVDEFNLKARDFYKFWKPGRVLVNGKPVEHHVGNKITEDLYYSKDWNTSYVVLGNVAYRIANPDALFHSTKMNRLSFVAYVDDFAMEDGAQPVEFTPSREDLKYTDRTKSTLQAVVNKFEVDILAMAEKQVKSVKTHAEAYKVWSHWTDMLGKGMFDSLTFNGEPFRSDFNLSCQRWGRNDYRNSVHSINRWNVEAMAKTMVITDFDITVSSSAKARINDYLFHTGNQDISYVLFLTSNGSHAKGLNSTNSPWVDWSQVVQISWDDLKAALPKKPKTNISTASGQYRVAGSWDYYTRNAKFVEKSIPTDTDEIYYITVRKNNHYAVMKVLNEMESDAAVLIVPQNRMAKLLRENPDVKSFIEVFGNMVVKKGEDLLSDDAKAVMAVDSSWVNWSNALDLSRVTDPEFARVEALVKNKDSLLKNYQRNIRLANYMHMGYNYVLEYRASGQSVYSRYPLLNGSNYTNLHEHVYTYINHIYALEKNK